MTFKKEIKRRTQDIILESIKRGNCQKQEILKDTGLAIETLAGGLIKLRKWGLISTNYRGLYKVEKEGRELNATVK